MSQYKNELIKSMDFLSSDPLVSFIGYGVGYGAKGMGTLVNVSSNQLIETSVSENLMMGLGIGLSLTGRKPVVFFERFDFVLNAADAIVNHLDKIKSISRSEYNPTAIIRVVVGGRETPPFTGETHIQDYSDAFSRMLSFPVIQLTNENMVFNEYKSAYNNLDKHSTMLVEYKDLIAV